MNHVQTNRRPTDSRNVARHKTGVRRRRRRKRKYTLYYLLFLIVVIITGITLSMTVFFNIHQFSVAPTEMYTSEEIISAARVEKGDNLIRLDSNAIEQKLIDKLVYCDSVQVTKQLPATLSIEVHPATVAYNYIIDGKYAYISSGGRILEFNQDTAYEGAMTVVGLDISSPRQGIFVGEQDSPNVALLNQLYASMEKAGLIDVTEIDLSDTSSVKIRYQDRITIEIDQMSEMDYMINASKNILDNNISSTSKGKVFYVSSTKSIHFLSETSG